MDQKFIMQSKFATLFGYLGNSHGYCNTYKVQKTFKMKYFSFLPQITELMSLVYFEINSCKVLAKESKYLEKRTNFFKYLLSINHI